MYILRFIFPPADGHLGRFQVLAITNKPTVNIRIQVHTYVLISFEKVSKGGIAE